MDKAKEFPFCAAKFSSSFIRSVLAVKVAEKPRRHLEKLLRKKANENKKCFCLDGNIPHSCSGSHLCRLPAPLPVLGIVGEPPHVPVGLDDLRPQDVVLLILPHGHRLQAAVELEGLRAQLQHWRGGEEEVEGDDRGGEKFNKEFEMTGKMRGIREARRSERRGKHLLMAFMAQLPVISGRS